jgi:hypothetical protein
VEILEQIDCGLIEDWQIGLPNGINFAVATAVALPNRPPRTSSLSPRQYTPQLPPLVS